jgi:deazaflavin-dependent oxidoreductase (nitroreductase family)
MPNPKDDLKERLTRYRQIKISVIGRKSGQTISIPVWFVLEGERLYLLPVRGSNTQWYRNVLKNPKTGIDARGVEVGFQAVPVTDAKAVKSVVEKFREKAAEHLDKSLRQATINISVVRRTAKS